MAIDNTSVRNKQIEKLKKVIVIMFWVLFVFWALAKLLLYPVNSLQQPHEVDIISQYFKDKETKGKGDWETWINNCTAKTHI